MKRLIICTMLISAGCSMRTGEPKNCSTFMFRDGSEIFVGHNLDETPGFHVPGLVCINKRGVYREGISYFEFISSPDDYADLSVPFEERPSPKISWISLYGSITFNSEGLDFPDGGVNEKGLSVFEMSLGRTKYRYDEGNPDLFMVLWIQYMLDNFASVDEAIRSAYDFNLQGWSWHYFVSDIDGDWAVIEFIDGEVVVHRREDSSYPVLCNASYSREVERLENEPGLGERIKRYLKGQPRFIRGVRMMEAYDRAHDGPPKDHAMKILEEIRIGGWNKWSILFDAGDMKIYFNTDSNRKPRYLSFDSFDFSTKPAEILDIHAGVSGDLAGSFDKYTYERNLGHNRERAGLLFADRFKGLIDNGVTAEIYAKRFADYSRRIRSR